MSSGQQKQSPLVNKVYLHEVDAMNPNLKPEDIDNMVMYERASERRSGAERRNGGLMKNNDLRQAAERSENPQPSAETKFVGEFGYQTPQ